jgi:hypothetical protein
MTMCSVLKSALIPSEALFTAKGIGDGEGNISADGRYVFLHDPVRAKGRLVDMRPRGNCPGGAFSSGEMCFGTVVSLDCALPDAACRIGHTTISPLGDFVVVKYSVKAKDGKQDDYLRIYRANTGNLTISPMTYPMNPPCRGSETMPQETGINGYIFRLAHEDVAVNPFDNDAEYVVGARRPSCGDSSMNRVVMVKLATGVATPISIGDHEEAPHHVSARATQRPGWAYVTYRSDTSCSGAPTGCRYRDEVVAFKMVGGDARACERWGRTRSDSHELEGDDDDEAQAVPSPDGRRVLFRSSWSLPDGCAPPSACGSESQINTYVMEPAPSK